jgi:hypothetical protein
MLKALKHIFRYNSGAQELILILDCRSLLSEILQIWAENPIPTSDSKQAFGRSVAELYIPNLGFALTRAAAVTQECLGRNACTPEEITAILQRVAKFVLNDFWRLVGSATQTGQLERLTSVSCKNLDDQLAELSGAPAESPWYPPSGAMEASLADCRIDQLVRLEIVGIPPVDSVKVWAPRNCLDTELLRQLELGMIPEAIPSEEIRATFWLNYFVPTIVQQHVWDRSRQGDYVSRSQDRFSLKLSDYSRIGLA